MLCRLSVCIQIGKHLLAKGFHFVLSALAQFIRLHMGTGGAFFLADLYGLEVRDADTGEVLGKIEDVLTPPASNVYVVKGGKQSHMIPAVPEFVIETNVDGGYIRVRLIEGM